ncbi:hypothetical protein KK137_06220 [Croceibacterium sp. LX-88]|uniref:50S ribosomal protein L13 n=1 Tax=Croceibacterium selenioxidans TaxID=2838833 RepID=A0ABS5W2F5_9SPHN|nr:hypothetical protein [Croceibacterium selenioxidans]MBT2133925.1 hypothetical protein [Croceibacterium selenioxidans]
MFALLKAIVLGAFLAGIVSLFIGSSGATGGMLNVRQVVVADFQFFWSWAVFLIGAGLSFGIFLLMD